MTAFIVPTEHHPVPRLLGGSSKLAKLAEERRKKVAASNAAQSPTNQALHSLDRLSLVGNAENQVPAARSEPRKYPTRKKREPSPPPREPTPPAEEPQESLPDLRSAPTDFGLTLSVSPSRNISGRMTLQELYGSDHQASAFQEPSPDDNVLKAQQSSKGLKKS